MSDTPIIHTNTPQEKGSMANPGRTSKVAEETAQAKAIVWSKPTSTFAKHPFSTELTDMIFRYCDEDYIANMLRASRGEPELYQSVLTRAYEVIPLVVYSTDITVLNMTVLNNVEKIEIK